MDKTFDLYPTIDLTVAHTDLPITTVRPLTYLQFWCDGVLDGISVKIGTQSVRSLHLDEINVIPTPENPDTIYLTNDVRAGRSQLKIYFIHSDTPLSLTFGGEIISQAELAVRSGSIDSFDRRGEIIFQHDLQRPLPAWLISYTGHAGSVVSTSSYPYDKQRATKLSTAANLNDAEILYHSMEYPFLTRIGFEMLVYAENFLHGKYEIKVIFDNGTNQYRVALRYDGTAFQAQYLNSAGTYTSLGTIYLPAINGTPYIPFKFVFDTNTLAYIRAIIGNNQFSMTNIPVQVAASTGYQYLFVYFTVTNDDGVVTTAQIRNAIVTQNEP